VIWPDGTVRWTEARAEPVYDEHGECVRIMGLVVDITERKQAEAALQASEERYRAVVESQTELVCRYLPDTTLTLVNEAYCRFFGQPREALIGRKFVELVPEPARAAVLGHVASLVANPRVHVYEHEVVVADGSVRWQQWVDSAIFAQDGRVAELQGIGRDITDRKRAEEANQKLAHASRLAAMGELTASIAHEINQPLGAILANADAAELLLDAGRLDEVRRALADIRKDDLRASEVVRRIRELVRTQEFERHPLDLNEMVAGVLQLLGADAARRGVALEAVLARDLPPVRGDRVHLQQVLLNLLLNGMEAMAETPAPRRRLAVRTTPNGTGVEVSVTDAGVGIPPAQLPRLFESFFTTKREGMGLGLSIARSIVEAHGGRIWAENRPEGGGAFRFTVPAGPGT
jgi:PAS domain S-box-containing protein